MQLPVVFECMSPASYAPVGQEYGLEIVDKIRSELFSVQFKSLKA